MKNVSGNKKLVPPNCIGQDRGLGATKVATATRMDDLWPCGAAGGYAFCHLSRLISGVWRMEVWGLKQRFSRCVYYVTPVDKSSTSESRNGIRLPGSSRKFLLIKEFFMVLLSFSLV